MMKKLILATVVLGCVGAFFVFRADRAPTSSSAAAVSTDLIDEVRDQRHKASDDHDLALYVECRERLDRALKQIPEDDEFYQQVLEERYLHLPMAEITSYLVLNELALAEETIDEMAFYLEPYQNDPRYAVYLQQLADHRRSYAQMSTFVQRSNEEMQDYLQLWLQNYRKFEGRFPQDMDEFKVFLVDYAIDYPTSYTFTEYVLATDSCFVTFYDSAVDHDYELQIPLTE